MKRTWSISPHATVLILSCLLLSACDSDRLLSSFKQVFHGTAANSKPANSQQNSGNSSIAQRPVCSIQESAAPAPSPFPDTYDRNILKNLSLSQEPHTLNRINGLFAHGQFEALDKGFADDWAALQRGELASKVWEGRLNSLADMNISVEDGLKQYQQWINKTNSPYSHLLRGMFLNIQAWEARGKKYLKDTPPAQIQELQRLARLAEADLNEANGRMLSCAVCFAELIKVQRALYVDEYKIYSAKLFNNAMAADPRSRAAVFSFFRSLYPQWGGSLAEMEDFIMQMHAHHPDPNVIAELESTYCHVLGSEAHYAEHDVGKALKLYEKSVTSRPADLALKALADLYLQNKQYAKAIHALQLNLQTNKADDVVTLETLAQAFAAAGDQANSRLAAQKHQQANDDYINYR